MELNLNYFLQVLRDMHHSLKSLKEFTEDEPRVSTYAKTYGFYFINGCMSLIEIFQEHTNKYKKNPQCLAFCYYMIG